MDRININTTYTDKTYVRQRLAFEVYDRAGVPASESFPVRMERNGQFFSVGMLIEQPDSDLLEREGLDPDGALLNTPKCVEMYRRRLLTLMDEILQGPDTPPTERLLETRLDTLAAAGGGTLPGPPVQGRRDPHAHGYPGSGGGQPHL